MKFIELCLFVLLIQAQNSQVNTTKELEETVKEVESEDKELEDIVSHETKNWDEKEGPETNKSRRTAQQISGVSQDEYEKCKKNVNELTEKEGELREEILDAVQDAFVKTEEERRAQNQINEIEKAIAELQNSTYEAEGLNKQLKEQLKNNTEERKKLQTLIADLDIKIKVLEDKYRKRKKNDIVPKDKFWLDFKNGIMNFLDWKKKLISFVANIKQQKLQNLQSIMRVMSGGLLGTGC